VGRKPFVTFPKFTKPGMFGLPLLYISLTGLSNQYRRIQGKAIIRCMTTFQSISCSSCQVHKIDYLSIILLVSNLLMDGVHSCGIRDIKEDRRGRCVCSPCTFCQEPSMATAGECL
jgi:hypothetical protein